MRYGELTPAPFWRRHLFRRTHPRPLSCVSNTNGNRLSNGEGRHGDAGSEEVAVENGIAECTEPEGGLLCRCPSGPPTHVRDHTSPLFRLDNT